MHRRAVRDYYLGLGVHGTSSDNVTYLMTSTALGKRDPGTVACGGTV